MTDLLTLYGVTDEDTRSKFLTLVRQSNTEDRWRKYSDILPDWFETYVGLEAAAATIRGFEVQFVHGLFQTEDYARAVSRLRKTASDDEIERRVALRLKRQELLSRPNPPYIRSVMDEAVLRRVVGGPAVGRPAGSESGCRMLQKVTLTPASNGEAAGRLTDGPPASGGQCFGT